MEARWTDLENDDRNIRFTHEAGFWESIRVIEVNAQHCEVEAPELAKLPLTEEEA